MLVVIIQVGRCRQCGFSRIFCIFSLCTHSQRWCDIPWWFLSFRMINHQAANVASCLIWLLCMCILLVNKINLRCQKKVGMRHCPPNGNHKRWRSHLNVNTHHVDWHIASITECMVTPPVASKWAWHAVWPTKSHCSGTFSRDTYS